MLPPRNADAGEAVSGEDLGESVDPFAADDLVVTRIVAKPPAFDPEKTQINPAAVGAQDAVDA